MEVEFLWIPRVGIQQREVTKKEIVEINDLF